MREVHGAGRSVSGGVRPAVAGMQGCYRPVGCYARPHGRGSEAGGQAPAKPASAIRAARRGRGSAAAALNAHKRDADL